MTYTVQCGKTRILLTRFCKLSSNEINIKIQIVSFTVHTVNTVEFTEYILNESKIPVFPHCDLQRTQKEKKVSVQLLWQTRKFLQKIPSKCTFLLVFL